MHTFLRGVRVLDFSRYLPGPYATHILVEMGAEVINVEEPGGGNPMRMLPPLVDGTSHAFQALHAGKKSVTLDLKKEGAREEVMKLAATSRVVVESYRPGVAKRLGVDFDSLRAVRPDVVYCSLSGYGQHGPYRDHPGHDINFVGLAGLLSVGALPGITTADLCGGLMASTAILGALQSEKGAYIDLSLTDAIFSWMQLQAAHVAAGESPNPFLTGATACYRVYDTADRPVAVAALEVKFWDELCRRMGLSGYEGNPYQADPIPEMAETFRKKTREVWLKELAGLPVSAVHSLDEAMRDEHLVDRGMVEEFEGQDGSTIRRVAFPPRIRNGDSRPPRRAPRLGEHNQEFLDASKRPDS